MKEHFDSIGRRARLACIFEFPERGEVDVPSTVSSMSTRIHALHRLGGDNGARVFGTKVVPPRNTGSVQVNEFELPVNADDIFRLGKSE